MVGEIKEVRRDFKDDIDYLNQILQDPDQPVEVKVEAASILWDLSEQAKNALEPFKDQLRDLARDSGESKYKAASSDGKTEATVITPAQRLSLRKGVDMEELRRSKWFGTLIEEKTSYTVRRTAADHLNQLTTSERDQWLDALSYNDPTPRVSFSRISSHHHPATKEDQ
ncbi:MAG: hypothetical protein VXX11_03685 [Planctomycetota bacterium]|nr:hypothetical protein [Planctomycetota bacterium]